MSQSSPSIPDHTIGATRNPKRPLFDWSFGLVLQNWPSKIEVIEVNWVQLVMHIFQLEKKCMIPKTVKLSHNFPNCFSHHETWQGLKPMMIRPCCWRSFFHVIVACRLDVCDATYHQNWVLKALPVLVNTKKSSNSESSTMTSTWFQIFSIFTPTWGNYPVWQAYVFKRVVHPPAS